MTLPIIINIILRLAFATVLSIVLSFAIHIFAEWVYELTYNTIHRNKINRK